MRELPCETCGGDMLFEAPPCADGHGPDCPELACTGCGSAILLGPLLVLVDGEPRLDSAPRVDGPRVDSAPRRAGRRSGRPSRPRRLAA